MRTLALILVLLTLLSGCASHNLVQGQDPAIVVEEPNPWPTRLAVIGMVLLVIGGAVGLGLSASGSRYSSEVVSTCYTTKHGKNRCSSKYYD